MSYGSSDVRSDASLFHSVNNHRIKSNLLSIDRCLQNAFVDFYFIVWRRGVEKRGKRGRREERKGHTNLTHPRRHIQNQLSANPTLINADVPLVLAQSCREDFFHRRAVGCVAEAVVRVAFCEGVAEAEDLEGFGRHVCFRGRGWGEGYLEIGWEYFGGGMRGR